MPTTEYNQAYYEANKDRILKKNYKYEKKRLANDPEYRERKRQQTRDSQRKRRQKHREIWYAALDTPCVDCGIQLPSQVMEFDHVRGDKLFNICQSYNGKGGYVSYEALHAEIAKCDVRCPNCHRLRHHHERQATHNLQPREHGSDGD